MKLGSVLLACLGVAACSGAPDQTNNAAATVAPGLTWAAAPEGSAVAKSEPLAGSPFANVVRCWPRDGRQHCLDVSRADKIGYSVKLLVLDERPTEWPASSEGYTCRFGGDWGIRGEAVSRADGTITKNEGDGGPARWWSRSEAEKLMRDNKVSGHYFNCREVARILTNGSMASVDSTVLTYAAVAN